MRLRDRTLTLTGAICASVPGRGEDRLRIPVGGGAAGTVSVVDGCCLCSLASDDLGGLSRYKDDVYLQVCKAMARLEISFCLQALPSRSRPSTGVKCYSCWGGNWASWDKE